MGNTQERIDELWGQQTDIENKIYDLECRIENLTDDDEINELMEEKEELEEEVEALEEEIDKLQEVA